MHCPKCDAELEFGGAEPDVEIMCGGWYYGDCDIFVSEHDTSRELMEGDVQIRFSDGSNQYGTPISEISTHPRTKGYEE